MRLAHGADRAFEFVHAGAFWNPAGLQMQLGHPLVVTPEKGDEVLRQVFLVELGQRAHDAEVKRDVAAEGLRRHAHLDVAGVHVGVKETVSKHLREEDGDTVARELWDVDAGIVQPLRLADRNAFHALHDDHGLGAQLPVHLRHHDQLQAFHVAAQLSGIGGFAHQIELVVQVVVELGNHFARLQSLAIGRQPLDPARQGAHQRDVVVDHRQHVGSQHLDGNFAAVLQRGEMNLRDRSTGHRLDLEAGEHGFDALAESLFDQLTCLSGGEWRYVVLQLREFVGNVRWDQVAPRRQHLTELHEDRPEALERQPQALSSRHVEPPACRDHANQHLHPALAEVGQCQLVETVAINREDDEKKTREMPHRGGNSEPPASPWAMRRRR